MSDLQYTSNHPNLKIIAVGISKLCNPKYVANICIFIASGTSVATSQRENSVTNVYKYYASHHTTLSTQSLSMLLFRTRQGNPTQLIGLTVCPIITKFIVVLQQYRN
jgi:hypothetical protein